MVQPGTLFAAFKQHQGWRHHFPSTAWRVFQLLLLLLLFPTLALLIHSLLGLNGGEEAAAAENRSQPKMTETLHHFRAHQVATGAAGREGVMKFVVQESIGVLPTGQESGSESGSSSPPWRTLSFKEVAGLWWSSSTFAEVFAASIAAVPFEALFWESAPVTKDTMVREEDDGRCQVPKYQRCMYY